MSPYSLLQTHLNMNFDTLRNAAYRRAIVAAVGQDSVVLDLGAGLGVLGFLAARAGARKVYLVEPERVILLTEKIRKLNRLENVECIRATAETLRLVEKADIILSVFTGNFLLTEDLLPSLFWARDRFLAPGGTLIPDRGRMMVAPVSAPAYYQEKVDRWALSGPQNENLQRFGIEYPDLRAYVVNSLFYESAEKLHAQLLAEPACLLDLNFMTAQSADCDTEAELAVAESGVCHGWLGWFETRLGSEWLTTAPDADRTHWRPVFMPLDSPLQLSRGQSVTFRLKRPEYGEWTWATEADGLVQTQSTFLSQPMTPGSLQKRSDGYTPSISEKGEAMQFVLLRFDGGTSVATIADALMDRFSGAFPTRREALNFVKSLVREAD
jgi:ubiquinone/menaquinone biosynthesis C-methylase UbiE